MQLKNIALAGALAFCLSASAEVLAAHPMLDKVIERYEHKISWEEARDKALTPRQAFLVKQNGRWGIMGRDGAALLPVEYDKITRLKNVLLTKLEGKWGVADDAGNVLIDAEYDSIKPLGKRWLLLKADGKVGVADYSGNIILPAKYDKIQPGDDSFIITQNERVGLFDTSGKQLLDCIYYKAQRSGSGGYIAGSEDSLWYMDGSRKLITSEKFLDGKPFSEELAAVQTAAGWGYMDEGGKIVIAPQFTRAERFMEGAAYVEQGEARFFIDAAGSRLFDAPEGKYINGFRQDSAVFKNDGSFHFIGHDGAEKFAVEAASIFKMEDGKIAVTRTRHNISLGGLAQSAFTMVVGIPTIPGVGKSFYDTVVKLGYYDADGNELISTKHDYNSTIIDERIVAIADDKAGLLTPEGSELIPLAYDDMSELDYDNGQIAAVRQEDSYGLYEIGRGLIASGYLNAGEFAGGMAPVQVTASRWAYIDDAGKLAMGSKYWQWATTFTGEHAIAKSIDGAYCIIDKAGNVVAALDNTIEEISALTPDTAIFKMQDKYGVIDDSGAVVLEPLYEKIENL